MAKRPYYTLVTCPDPFTAWGIEFGAYDKEDVVNEVEDYKDHGWKARQLKIIKTADAKTASIELAVAALNKGLVAVEVAK